MSSYSDVWLLISGQITTSSLFSFATQGKLPKNVRREREEGDCAEERDATQGIRAENMRREQKAGNNAEKPAATQKKAQNLASCLLSNT